MIQHYPSWRFLKAVFFRNFFLQNQDVKLHKEVVSFVIISARQFYCCFLLLLFIVIDLICRGIIFCPSANDRVKYYFCFRLIYFAFWIITAIKYVGSCSFNHYNFAHRSFLSFGRGRGRNSLRYNVRTKLVKKSTKIYFLKLCSVKIF